MRLIWILLPCCLLIIGNSIFSPAYGAEREPQDLYFEVWREETPIGRHEIEFARNGEDLHVKVAIDLEVKFAFLTLFSYSHRNREHWRDNRLIAIETETNDDGEVHWVRGKAVPDGFEVESSLGKFLAPASIIPTSYWHPNTVDQEQLLDTQHGRLVAVSSKFLEVDSGLDGVAARYAMRGGLDLDLWYDGQKKLSKIAFEARGGNIHYVPRANTIKAIQPAFKD